MNDETWVAIETGCVECLGGVPPYHVEPDEVAKVIAVGAEAVVREVAEKRAGKLDIGGRAAVCGQYAVVLIPVGRLRMLPFGSVGEGPSGWVIEDSTRCPRCGSTDTWTERIQVPTSKDMGRPESEWPTVPGVRHCRRCEGADPG